MLTSKIIKHFKHQDWGAAFIDFIVVLLGIFVAIQVNNWNQERVNNQKERVILKQLYNEVSNNVEQIQSLVALHRDRAGELDYVIKGVVTNTIDPNSDRAKNPLIQMFQLPPIEISMATYRSLVATGDISLIQDQQLKTLLFSLDAAIEAEKSYLIYFRQLIASDRDYTRRLITLKPNADQTGTTLHVDFKLLREEGELLILVANSKHTHLHFSRIREDVAKQFEKVKTYIGNMHVITEG